MPRNNTKTVQKSYLMQILENIIYYIKTKRKTQVIFSNKEKILMQPVFTCSAYTVVQNVIMLNSNLRAFLRLKKLLEYSLNVQVRNSRRNTCNRKNCYLLKPMLVTLFNVFVKKIPQESELHFISKEPSLFL